MALFNHATKELTAKIVFYGPGLCGKTTNLKILHQRLELILHSREFLAFVEAVRAGQAQPQQAIEFVAGTESTWVEATGALIPPLDGQKGEWTLFVLHDITRQKKLEAVRKDFVANVSHELRTPLSIIKGYVETLVDGHRDMPVEDRERFLQTVQRHTERLNSLLDDLLTLSRLESMNPGLHCESTDLARLIAGAIEDYRGRPVAAQHELEFSSDAALPELLIATRVDDRAVGYWAWTKDWMFVAVWEVTAPPEMVYVQTAAFMSGGLLGVLKPILGGGFQEPMRDFGGTPPAGEPAEAEADRVRSAIEEALGPAPIAVDELIRLCGVPAAAVLTVLLELELAGRLARHPGNRVSWL